MTQTVHSASLKGGKALRGCRANWRLDAFVSASSPVPVTDEQCFLAGACHRRMSPTKGMNMRSVGRGLAVLKADAIVAATVVVHPIRELVRVGEAAVVFLDLRQLDHEPRITVLVEEVQRPALVALQDHVVRLQPAAADGMPGRDEIVHDEPDVMETGWDPGVEGAWGRVEEEDCRVAGGQHGLVRIFPNQLHPHHLSEEPPRILPVGHRQRDVIKPHVAPRARSALQRLGTHREGTGLEVGYRLSYKHVWIDWVPPGGPDCDPASHPEAFREKMLEGCMEHSRPVHDSGEQPVIRLKGQAGFHSHTFLSSLGSDPFEELTPEPALGSSFGSDPFE